MNEEPNNLDDFFKLLESLPDDDPEDKLGKFIENQKYDKGNIYMYRIAEQHSNDIWMNINRMSGMPCIKGTRIPISLIVSCLKDGLSIENIMEDYKLSRQQVESVLDYVIDVLDKPYM